MLKKIPVEELRLGMHLHAMCGAWLDHPFWHTRFVLRDPVDLDKLRASSVAEVWIDVAKGLDVAPPAPGAAAPRDAVREQARAEHAAPAPHAKPPAEGAASADLGAELRRASVLVNQSRQAVSSLFSEARMGRALDAEKCLPPVDEIAASVWRNPGAIVSLARLKTHDDYTYMHSMAVCALMVSLGRQLGMDETAARDIGLAGMLHDMGKAKMPLEVLNKPGKLSDAEYSIMKTHPEHGHALLLEGQGVGEVALDVTLHHHERPDGKGYPHGLSGDALSHVARMGAVCDVYDAITSNRPYKNGWDPAESIAKMACWTGQFDAEIFQAFVKSLGIYPIGSLVRMRSGKLGVVVEQNGSSLVSPKVKLFFSTRSNMPVPVEPVDLSASGCHDAIVARESNAQWKFPHLDELWAGPEVLRKIGRS
ncbi:HD-GYP domain-containing protein [uncultured Piscinibacter sp.]|uniref:HD-GYP domain-containing protein n=1 Tax=uncultured Piscinibacter sp. TaxID=1131835 RepID=UPI00260F582D|nr:HD-GYP domain-containing protein [uncultured Piscinibacter sp.]